VSRGGFPASGDRWLRPGDVMDAQITGLGTQRNGRVAESEATP